MARSADTWLRNSGRMPVPDHEGGGVVHQRAAHNDARMDGGAIHRPIEQLFVGDGLVARVEEDRDEDLVAPPAKAGFEVAPGEVRRGERAVAAKQGLHPSGVQLKDGMHPCAVLGRQEEQAQHVVGIVEELAQAPGGVERGGVDVDADEPEQLVIVEGGGSRARDSREECLGRWRGRAGRGIGWGSLGADGGGKRGIGRHDGSILGSAGERPGGARSTPPDHAPVDAPLDLSDERRHGRGHGSEHRASDAGMDASRHAVASPGRIPAVFVSGSGWGMARRDSARRWRFWALALLWLPAGGGRDGGDALRGGRRAGGGARHVAGDGADDGGLAGAGCAVRAAARARVPAAVAAGLPARGVDGGDRARCGDGSGVAGGGAARSGRDRRLCGGAQRPGVGRVVLAGTAGMTPADRGPAAQQRRRRDRRREGGVSRFRLRRCAACPRRSNAAAE